MLIHDKTILPNPDQVLPGRAEEMKISPVHFVNGRSLRPPFPDGIQTTYFGMGCFWGAERLFWTLPGVYSTAVGFGGGETPNPTYEEVCTGLTGHIELVLVAFDPQQISYDILLRHFWEQHDPTQGMRQNTSVGTQYRSALFVTSEDHRTKAESSRQSFQKALDAAGGTPVITTEIALAPRFYYAEDYHQQYLAKNPDGFCGLKGTGVVCPI